MVLEIKGDSLQIDLGGGDGGLGGVGVRLVATGGTGAQGTSARTAWIEGFGIKTAAGCAAGPGRGGSGRARGDREDKAATAVTEARAAFFASLDQAR